jgi:hypothetical protein
MLKSSNCYTLVNAKARLRGLEALRFDRRHACEDHGGGDSRLRRHGPMRPLCRDSKHQPLSSLAEPGAKGHKNLDPPIKNGEEVPAVKAAGRDRRPAAAA